MSKKTLKGTKTTSKTGETYRAMKDRQQKEISDFPMFFAFTQKSFDEGMVKLGLKPEETNKISKLGDLGGFYRKTDAKTLYDLFDRHEKEQALAIENDATGDGFVFDMFNYELRNHEYVYTGDVTEAIEAVGFTTEEVYKNKKLLHGLNKAIKAQPKDY